MDIMELGAIGELVGGAAVIATILYLAVQVRQNTPATFAASPGYRTWWIQNKYPFTEEFSALADETVVGRASVTSPEREGAPLASTPGGVTTHTGALTTFAPTLSSS